MRQKTVASWRFERSRTSERMGRGWCNNGQVNRSYGRLGILVLSAPSPAYMTDRALHPENTWAVHSWFVFRLRFSTLCWTCRVWPLRCACHGRVEVRIALRRNAILLLAMLLLAILLLRGNIPANLFPHVRRILHQNFRMAILGAKKKHVLVRFRAVESHPTRKVREGRVGPGAHCEWGEVWPKRSSQFEGIGLACKLFIWRMARCETELFLSLSVCWWGRFDEPDATVPGGVPESQVQSPVQLHPAKKLWARRYHWQVCPARELELSQANALGATS